MIVGLTGSFGAGKGVVAEYLINTKGFKHLSARALITEEIENRGMPVNRDSMIVVGNDLRAQGGPTYIYERLIKKAKEIGGNVVVESIRAVAEALYTQKQGGIVVGVDADPEIRYTRAVDRGSETDQVSFEKWRQQEIEESNPDDPTKQDIFGALKVSDFIVNNNGTLEELHAQIDGVLAKIAAE